MEKLSIIDKSEHNNKGVSQVYLDSIGAKSAKRIPTKRIIEVLERESILKG